MYIRIKVVTEAKKERVVKVSDDTFNISVREKPERNMANKRILEIVRERFPESVVRLVSGHHSPAKIVSVDSSL